MNRGRGMLLYPCERCGGIWYREVGERRVVERRCWECNHLCWAEAMPTVGDLQREQRHKRKRGIKRSAEVRQNENADRDCRIHDARAAGKVPKAIADDEGLSPSQVRRILNKPRP
jgi:hypothetical protein